MSPIFTAGRPGAASCTLESGSCDLEIPQPSEGCVAVFCTRIGAILLYQAVCLTLSRRPGYPFVVHTPFPFLSASPLFRLVPGPQAACLFCEIRLPAAGPVKDRLWLAGGKSSSSDQPASVFSASSLPGPAVNPAGRKTIGLRYRTTGGKKEKLKSLQT